MSVSEREIDPRKTQEVDLKSLLPLPKNVALFDDTVDNRVAFLTEMENFSCLPDEQLDNEIEAAFKLLLK